MGTRRPVNEINLLISKIIDREFKHRGELADTLGISTQTLPKWVEVSDYSWDDFKFKYGKSLKTKIQEKGGIDYLKKKFKAGYKVKDIAAEFNADPLHTQTVINRLLAEKGLTKYDIGYRRYTSEKTDGMFHLIEEKGGLPYILSSKMEGKSIYDIADEIGNGMTRDYIAKYLKQYNLIFMDFNSYNNIYYIPHLCKWRGSLIIDGTVYDTELCDDIYSALDQVEKLKSNK